jgi:hypothetical protein
MCALLGCQSLEYKFLQLALVDFFFWYTKSASFIKKLTGSVCMVHLPALCKLFNVDDMFLASSFQNSPRADLWSSFVNSF